jgi:hypothetical protein
VLHSIWTGIVMVYLGRPTAVWSRGRGLKWVCTELRRVQGVAEVAGSCREGAAVGAQGSIRRTKKIISKVPKVHVL